MKLTKYRDFQYRLLLNKIVLNKDLYRWSKRDNPLSDFCQSEEEMAIHFFAKCTKVTPIWENFCTTFSVNKEMCPMELIFNLANPKPSHIANCLTIIFKQYLHSAKCQGSKPNWHELRTRIEKIHEIEMYHAKRNGLLTKHVKTWVDAFPDLKEK